MNIRMKEIPIDNKLDSKKIHLYCNITTRKLSFNSDNNFARTVLLAL